jgi:hypothetical protein
MHLSRSSPLLRQLDSKGTDIQRNGSRFETGGCRKAIFDQADFLETNRKVATDFPQSFSLSRRRKVNFSESVRKRVGHPKTIPSIHLTEIKV